MTNIVEYNEDNYRDYELHQGMAVIRFYAPWCQPCVQNKPMFAQLAAYYAQEEQVLGQHRAGKIMFGQVNIDLAPILTLRYNVFGLPSTLIFKDSLIVERIAGVKTLQQLIEKIELHQ